MSKTNSYFIKTMQQATTLNEIHQILADSQNYFLYYKGEKIVKTFLKQYTTLFPQSKVDVDKDVTRLLKKYINHFSISNNSRFNLQNFVHVVDENSSHRWLTATNGFSMIRVPTALHTGMYCLVDNELYKYNDEEMAFLYPVPSQYTMVGLVKELPTDDLYYEYDDLGIHKSAIPSKNWYVFFHNLTRLAPVIVSETIGIGEGRYVTTTSVDLQWINKR